MQLVVLAAGHGRRFGGLKQLAPVGPNGEAIMDYTAADALAAGFSGVVLVVRPEVQDELLEHIGKYWPPELEVVPVVQGPIAGTAQAVASARPAVRGPFGVANADDLYGPAALALLGKELADMAPRSHLTVAYRLTDTVITDAPVTRGVCETDPDGYLLRVVEEVVIRQPDGFRARPVGAPEGDEELLSGEQVVSMNLWGFEASIFDELEAALASFDPATAPHEPGKPPEVLLPSVVADALAGERARVRVVATSGRCIGLTHPDDLPRVREIVASERGGEPAGR